ncbi:MAG: DUF421 domain-containing protein [Bacillota bacterium]|nr:DUF421 domain-containing protein [Bacillota bacterium]
MDSIIKVILNSLIVFFLVFLMARIIGKKLLSQMTFFDFVIGVTIGTVGGAFITTEIRGFYVLLSPVVLTVLVVILGYLSLSSVAFRKLVEGEPVIVIQNGKIFENNLRKLRYNLDDLMAQLRVKKVFDLSQVEFAILEPHGQLSVLKKSQYETVTPQDLGLSTTYQGVSSEIIRDGEVVEQNLEQNHLSHEWLQKELASRNIKDIKNVVLATLATNGTLYVDLKNDNLNYIQEVEDDDSLI